MNRKAIIFDLDGTLVDSLPDIIASFQHSFAVLGLPVPDSDAVRAEIGKPLEAMCALFAPDHAAALAAEYRRYYPQHFTDTSRPFPGVTQLLEALRDRGYKTAIATTKRSDMARRFVEALGLAPLLDHVQGTDGFPHKPAPDVIHRALERVGGEGLWMVGDTVTDIQAGKAAGLRTYAVSWGTQGAATLATASPDVLAKDLAGLLDALPSLHRIHG